MHISRKSSKQSNLCLKSKSNSRIVQFSPFWPPVRPSARRPAQSCRPQCSRSSYPLVYCSWWIHCSPFLPSFQKCERSVQEQGSSQAGCWTESSFCSPCTTISLDRRFRSTDRSPAAWSHLLFSIRVQRKSTIAGLGTKNCRCDACCSRSRRIWTHQPARTWTRPPIDWHPPPWSPVPGYSSVHPPSPPDWRSVLLGPWWSPSAYSAPHTEKKSLETTLEWRGIKN